MIINAILMAGPQGPFKDFFKYHKFWEFQDNTANRNFFRLTEDWAFISWRIREGDFQGSMAVS